MKKIKNILNKLGWDVKRYPTYLLKNRISLLEKNKINTILDIGANIGQYGLEMRKLGYRGNIISFEPLSSVFKELEKNLKNDANWHAQNLALGDKNETTEINISNTTASSSLLDMLPNHTNAAPETKYIKKEKIRVVTLDSIFSKICKPEDKVFLKIDVQGFEENMLRGAKESIKHVSGIQIELSIVPLYSNELLFDVMISYLNKLGFKLYSLEPGFSNPTTGQLLQVDGIFFKD